MRALVGQGNAAIIVSQGRKGRGIERNGLVVVVDRAVELLQGGVRETAGEKGSDGIVYVAKGDQQQGEADFKKASALSGGSH